MAALISIITVCFNSEKTISRTIESVINQTYKNLEYIIIDGASQDKTLSIISAYQAQYSQLIKVISEPDTGIYNAMNKGIKIAEGKIIGILNSDDWYEHNAIEIITENYKKYGKGIYYGFLRLMKNGKEFNIERTNYCFLDEKMIQHPSSFISKDLYNLYGLYDEKFKSAADYELMLRMKKKGVAFVVIDSVLTNFTTGGMSSTLQGTIENLIIRRKYHVISKNQYYFKYVELYVMENKTINVWVIPSFYPTEDHPLRGIFFKEQAEGVSKFNVNITVLYSESRSLKELTIRKIRKFHFQRKLNKENSLFVYRKCGWNLFRLQFNAMFGQRIWVNDIISLAEDLIKKGNIPDIVHAHCAVGAGFAALKLKSKYEIPYIVTEHSTGYASTPLPPIMLDNIRKVFENSFQSIAVSQPFKNLLHRTVRLANSKLIVIPNFINTDYFLPSGNIKDSSEFTFLTICHLVQKKRVDRLLQAFSIIANTQQNIKLIIGGTGPEEYKLKALSIKLGINKNVTFLGELSREMVRTSMHKANCFVLPSDIETFGVVLIEAMASGLPVIATKSGGPEDIVNRQNGLLIEHSVEALSEAMVYMKNNYKNYDSNSIRLEAINRFSNNAISLKYYQLYLNTITENNSI